ncbi:PHP domain-containing protein [Syntrophomonas palmitatica]|uniref:PHP domain-containing protein n=1 Tax=Syntrophomonas palmitatica TaxID=402877 RepID=UPI0006D24420|nr:PHP domain-containing protein [Syntrophomonas palmitatica]
MKPDFSGFLREHAAADLAESWQGAGINHIEVDNHNAAWYLHIELKKPLPAAVISQTQEKLLDVFPFLSTLEIIPALEDWEQGITSLLHIYAHENNNISKQEWNRLNWVIDGPRLDFLFEADRDFEVFINNQECSLISDWFRREYNLRILTRALCTQPNFESCLENRHEIKALNVLALRETSKKKNQGKRAYQKSVPSADSVLIPISELQEGMKNIVVEGEIWHKESHLLKGGRYVISYFITDFRDSIMVKTFADNLEQDDIKPGQWLRISGSVRYDENSREIVLFMDAYSLADKPVRNDDAAEKRVELHAHTKMSAMDGLTEVKDLIIRAAEWHHSAIAITDHGCIQAFPEAFSTAKKVQKEMGRPIKVIYGVEGYLVENDRKESPYHIILLAQNDQGLRNLYELVSYLIWITFSGIPKFLALN